MRKGSRKMSWQGKGESEQAEGQGEQEDVDGMVLPFEVGERGEIH
jgi:hypothetical protein